jgi:hypothetical protein
MRNFLFKTDPQSAPHYLFGIIKEYVGQKMHYRVKSWVIFNKGQFTHICQLNVGYGQDSVSGIVCLLCPARDWEILNCIKLTQHYKMH